MTRVCHLFDETAGWEQRVGVWQLLDRLDRAAYAQDVVCLGGEARIVLASLPAPVHVVPRVASLDFVSAPFLRRLLDKLGADVVHAWGTRAASVAVAATDLPVVVELFDPAQVERDAKIIRAISRSIGFGIVCNSERLRRLITEHGVSLELSTVVRPGVDFSHINKVQRSDLRKKLGLARDDFVIVVEEPIARENGQFDVGVAVCLFNHFEPQARLVVSGDGDKQREIARFCAGAAYREGIFCSGDGYPFEQLLAIADALVIASRGEVSTTAIAWAMAANTAIIAPAVYSVAELIGSGLNGILYKHEPHRPPTITIARLLRDRAKQDKMKEVARGHAYEVFGIRRRVDQIIQVYRNVESGNAAGEGITDSAVAG